MKSLWQATLSYACYGIIDEDSTVIQAAPIAKWMVGKSIFYVDFWIRGKGGTLTKVKQI